MLLVFRSNDHGHAVVYGWIRSFGSVVMMVKLSTLPAPWLAPYVPQSRKGESLLIVSEADLARATERLQAHLEEQPRVPVVVPIIIAPTGQMIEHGQNADN